MSSHPLEDRLTGIRRRVRRVLWMYGLSWVTAVFLGLVLVAGWGDWLFHFDDSGVRFILLVAVLGAAGWIGYRYLLTPLTVPFRDLDIARRIEDRYPGLQDSLASTVEFLARGQDPTIGSPVLQQAVIQQTLARVGRLDFDNAIQTRPLRKAAAVAAGVCFLAALTTWLYQPNARLAVQRLFVPWNAPAWPRQTNLRLLQADLRPLSTDVDTPLRLAKGDTLEFFAENSTGSLPSRVQLEYRPLEPAGSKVLSETLRPTSTRDKTGTARELAVGQLPSQKGSLEFRVIGGDDTTMRWRKVQVIPPPLVEDLHVTLTPPPYMRLPVEPLPAGVGHVQGYLGTRVDFVARINKPVQSATLRIKDVALPAPKISEDGRQVAASFTISEPGTYSYRLELKDTDGFEGGDPPRYEIRGTQDIVPEVMIDLPSSDLQVTPTAEVQVQVTAKDDLGLKGMRLVYQMGDDPAVEGSVATKPQTIPLLEGAERPQQHTAKYLWKLDGLKLAAGMRIMFHAEAGDDYNLGPEHVGRSIARTLIVVSPQEKGRELAQKQANLLEELQRTTKLQQATRQQINELQLQMQKVGKLQPADIDTLQRAELAQRQVTAQLTNPVDGLENAARDILSDLQANRLKEPEVERRAQKIANELGRLGSEQLPAIEQQLTRAKKQAEALERGDNSGERDASPQKSSAEKKGSPAEKLDKGSKKSSSADQQSSSGQDKNSTEKMGGHSASKAESKAEPAKKGTETKAGGDGDPDPPALGGNEKSDKSDSGKSSPKSTAGKQRPGQESGKDSPAGKADPQNSDPSSAPDSPDAGKSDPKDSVSESAGKSDQKGSDRKTAGKQQAGKSSPRKPSPVSKSSPKSDSGKPDEALDRVSENQREVVETLSELTQELAQWRSERETTDEVADLVNQQKELNKQIGELGQKTVTKSKDDLTPQEQADLAKAAERQKRQAEKLEQLETRMQQQAQQQESRNPTTAATMRNALEQSRQSATAGQMREAAGQINENRLGSATQTQQDVLRKLSEMQETLQNRRTGDTESLVKKMKQAEQELETLRNQQRSLQQQTQQANQNPDPQARKKELERLGKEQAQLREQMNQLARQLQRLQLHKASEAARRAAGRMEQAQQQMDQGESAQAAEQQQESLDDLEQAQRETARSRREAEEQLAQEQLEKIADQLQAMIGREQQVLDETRRLEGLRSGSGKLTRAQLRSLSETADSQKNLQQETLRLVKKLSAAEAFALALKGSARQMQRAVELLGERQTGEPTQRAEEAARQRFVDLIAAMNPDKKPGSGGKQNQGGEGGGKQNGLPGEGISGLAQLKILKTLQQELLDRTVELGKKRTDQKGTVTPEQQQELDDIARDQGAVADLARNLMQDALDNAKDEEEAEEEEAPAGKKAGDDVPAKKSGEPSKTRPKRVSPELEPLLKKEKR